MSEQLQGVVVALESASLDDLIGVIEVLVQEGFETLSLPADLDVLETVCLIYAHRVRIGVHKVTTADQARRAIAAGATFVLAQNSDDNMIAACGDVVCYPSAMTPREIAAVLDKPVAGALVYPADVLGANYGDALAELGLASRCVPARSIGAYSAQKWFDCGAPACVIDNQLIGDAFDDGDLVALRDRCGSFSSLKQGSES